MGGIAGVLSEVIAVGCFPAGGLGCQRMCVCVCGFWSWSGICDMDLRMARERGKWEGQQKKGRGDEGRTHYAFVPSSLAGGLIL